MKKVYSKKLGGEVFALAPEQLEVFRNAGYQTPAPEEVIADAGEATLTPPEDKRAYVVLNLKSGEFAVRVRSCTLKGSEYSAVVGEIVQAGLLKRLAEQADPDRPKPAAPAAGAASYLFRPFTVISCPSSCRTRYNFMGPLAVGRYSAGRLFSFFIPRFPPR